VSASSSSAALRQRVQELEAQLQVSEAKRHNAELRVQQLEARLRQELIEKYGPSSERLSDQQLQLLQLEPGVSRAEVRGEARRAEEPLPASPAEPRPRQRPHPGRQTLPAHLPRRELIIPAPAEQRQCSHCGGATQVIGYEESEQLDVIPPQYFVTVSKREKRACPRCRQAGVRTAPAPARIVEKSLLSDELILNIIVAKYCDHLPLYRQSAMLQRDSGVEISRATLDGLVMQVGELLIPISHMICKEIIASGYIQADETPVPVQLERKSGRHHQAYLWQYGTPGGGTVFDFRMGRNRDGPKRLLSEFEGLLQTDGYAAYNGCGQKVEQAACWAHARRKFVEAFRLNHRDHDAARFITGMNALFTIDAEARALRLDREQRHALRQSRTAPLLSELHADLRRTATSALPSSALGKAVSYTLGLWDRLTLFLRQPRLELSNNLAENSIRPIAVGRKNWIHVGSPLAGPKVAAIISVIETCRRLKVPVRQCLADVLPGLAARPHHQLATFTPAAWARAHALPLASSL
jgi:transposase